jgi:hypothetical protein
MKLYFSRAGNLTARRGKLIPFIIQGWSRPDKKNLRRAVRFARQAW